MKKNYFAFVLLAFFSLNPLQEAYGQIDNEREELRKQVVYQEGLISKDIVHLVKGAVVYIEVNIHGRKGDYTSSGSGFFINDQGLILTNHHVIDREIQDEYGITVDRGDVDIKVYVNSGEKDEKRYKAEIISSWVEGSQRLGDDMINMIDLALLKIECDSNEYLKFIDLNQLDLSYEVWVAGFPLGSNLSLSISKGPNISFKNGIISSMRKDDSNKLVVIDHTAPIAPGNSGGPLLTPTGYCVGINTWGIGTNVYWAIQNEIALNRISEVFKADKLATIGDVRSEPPVNEFSQLDEAIIAMKEGSFDFADDLISEYIEIYPEKPDGYFYFGNLKLNLGDYIGAIEDYDKAIELYGKDNPVASAAYNNRGVIKSI